jgi:hypothetical protein
MGNAGQASINSVPPARYSQTNFLNPLFTVAASWQLFFSTELTISFISHITLNLLKVFLSPFRQNLTIFGQRTSGIQLTSDKNILVVIVYYTAYGEFLRVA